MKTISTQARLMSLAMALVTTAVVLGSTVAGMQWSAESQPALIVMEKVTDQADRSAVNDAPSADRLAQRPVLPAPPSADG